MHQTTGTYGLAFGYPIINSYLQRSSDYCRTNFTFTLIEHANIRVKLVFLSIVFERGTGFMLTRGREYLQYKQTKKMSWNLDKQKIRSAHASCEIVVDYQISKKLLLNLSCFIQHLLKSMRMSCFDATALKLAQQIPTHYCLRLIQFGLFFD